MSTFHDFLMTLADIVIIIRCYPSAACETIRNKVLGLWKSLDNIEFSEGSFVYIEMSFRWTIGILFKTFDWIAD